VLTSISSELVVMPVANSETSFHYVCNFLMFKI
jgi:hypothetical protein